MDNNERAKGMAHLEAQFMSPEIELMGAWAVSCNGGETYTVPADLIGDEKAQEHGYPTIDAVQDYCEGTPDELDHPNGVEGLADAEYVHGYFARLSASGYMDCTEWAGPFETNAEAEEYLVDTYVDPDSWEEIEAAQG